MSISEAVSVPSRGLSAVVDTVEQLHRSTPEDVWDGLPTDGSKNHKHYLYSQPQQEAG